MEWWGMEWEWSDGMEWEWSDGMGVIMKNGVMGWK